MKLSIVSTLYESESYLNEFCARMIDVSKKLVGDNFEIILVNDGSPDNSLEIAVENSKKNSNIKVIDLTRNYGHHRAIMVGLNHAIGDRVFLIDSDLEEKPEWIFKFSNLMDSTVSDMVFGVQRKRKGSFFEKISGELFWRIIRIFSGLKIHRNQITARLMTSHFVKSLVSHKESELFFGGLCHITGFHQVPLYVQKQNTSPTTYSFSKKISLLTSSITSFSITPLKYMFFIGVTLSILSFFYISYLTLAWLLFNKTVPGYTSIMVSIWFFSSLIIICLGIIGIYLAKVFIEIKSRPTFIKKIIQNK